eukprot:38789_1
MMVTQTVAPPPFRIKSSLVDYTKDLDFDDENEASDSSDVDMDTLGPNHAKATSMDLGSEHRDAPPPPSTFVRRDRSESVPTGSRLHDRDFSISVSPSMEPEIKPEEEEPEVSNERTSQSNERSPKSNERSPKSNERSPKSNERSPKSNERTVKSNGVSPTSSSIRDSKSASRASQNGAPPSRLSSSLSKRRSRGKRSRSGSRSKRPRKRSLPRRRPREPPRNGRPSHGGPRGPPPRGPPPRGPPPRRPPLGVASDNHLFKTIMCKVFPRCARGARCSFAHGMRDLHHSEPCRFYPKCAKGKDCKYQHIAGAKTLRGDPAFDPNARSRVVADAKRRARDRERTRKTDRRHPSHRDNDHQSNHGDHQSNHSDHQSNNGDHQSNNGDHQSNNGDHQSNNGDHQSNNGDHQLNNGVNPPTDPDHQSTQGDHQSSDGDQPISHRSSSVHDDSQVNGWQAVDEDFVERASKRARTNGVAVKQQNAGEESDGQQRFRPRSSSSVEPGPEFKPLDGETELANGEYLLDQVPDVCTSSECEQLRTERDTAVDKYKSCKTRLREHAAALKVYEQNVQKHARSMKKALMKCVTETQTLKAKVKELEEQLSKRNSEELTVFMQLVLDTHEESSQRWQAVFEKYQSNEEND